MTIAKSGRGKGQWLKTEVKSGKLIISIGADVLAFAAQRHFDERAFEASEGTKSEADFYIARQPEFAEAVRKALEREAEDGTTLVHLCLDAAFDRVLDFGDGSDGMEER
jgi:hypothetical protein